MVPGILFPAIFRGLNPRVIRGDQFKFYIADYVKYKIPPIMSSEAQSLIDEPLRIKSLTDQLDMSSKPFRMSFTLDDLHLGTSLKYNKMGKVFKTRSLNREPVLWFSEFGADAVKAMVNAKVDAVVTGLPVRRYPLFIIACVIRILTRA